MSTFSTAYDALRTAIGTLLPDANELSNPYDTLENSDLVQDQAWGIKISSGTNTFKEISKNMTLDRSFDVVFMRRPFASEKNTEELVSVQKSLVEDMILLTKKIEGEVTIGLGGIVVHFRYVSDTGIVPVGDGLEFLSLEATYELEYFEATT